MHVNAWLKKEGYLVEKENAQTDEYFQSIDWEKTKAYCFGLSGIYINLKGREKQGIVEREDLKPLKSQIIAGLEGLVDPGTGIHAVKKAYDADDVYSGPYRNAGPDIVLGFEDGYRVSWECAIGCVGEELFSPNEKAWSGDHCVDQSVVPGIFFCNRRVPVEDRITLTDIAPTSLNVFGVTPPEYMDGKVFDIESG
jgi:predicted AlkP superfamily phosphohydrolase/phosphomutase